MLCSVIYELKFVPPVTQTSTRWSFKLEM